MALNNAGDSSSVEVSEEVLRRGRSATGSVTLGGRGAGGRAAGVEPIPPGVRAPLLSPAGLECRRGVLSPFVYLLSG
ncbi:UNVERIFIED_CONTAM: hypothetical protein Slati_0012400 [Sesamum latifolium]|uniref:Uncharacterized protein n=1 Tax=Sesamum latifolium TaxID=2727402 RepID=A0AAW2Y662_9LAMI